MSRAIFEFLAEDHDRLEGLLNTALQEADPGSSAQYQEFRKGLLRHIGIEETIVFPAITRLQNGSPAEDAARLRLDHGAIVALLVPQPTPEIFTTLRTILDAHNACEEREGGIYDRIDALTGEEFQDILAQISARPELPVLPCKPLHEVLEPVRRAVERAGYRL